MFTWFALKESCSKPLNDGLETYCGSLGPIRQVYTVHRSGAGSPQMPHPMAMAPQAIKRTQSPVGVELSKLNLSTDGTESWF